MPAAGSTRQDGRSADGLFLESKGQPATTHVSTEPSATAKGHYAGPSAAAQGVTAATSAAALPAHVASGNVNVGNTGSIPQGDAQSYQRESERIVEEERAASEKMPHYPELSERYTLISKMGE